MKIEGGCHCGSIRFEAEVDPATVVICHCTDCQTFSGSASRTVVRGQLVPRDQYWFRSSQAWLPNLSNIMKQDQQPILDETGGQRDS
jgi:hypothetical protein